MFHKIYPLRVIEQKSPKPRRSGAISLFCDPGRITLPRVPLDWFIPSIETRALFHKTLFCVFICLRQ